MNWYLFLVIYATGILSSCKVPIRIFYRNVNDRKSVVRNSSGSGSHSICVGYWSGFGVVPGKKCIIRELKKISGFVISLPPLFRVH